MFDYLMQQRFNGFLAIWLYWLPLALCAFGYTLRTGRNYRKDVQTRDDTANAAAKYYTPTDTIGTLIGRAVVTVLPIANTWAAAFDIGPMLFGKLFNWLGRVFDQPLVPKKPEYKG